MNLWHESDSVADDDYLAAPGAETEQDEDFVDEFGSWQPEQGFPDQFNAVRVWCDPDGTLTKVRVSLSWREKVGAEGLARAFGVCFMVMNNYYPTPADPRLPDLAQQPAAERLTAESLAQVRGELAELSAKLAALPPGPASSWRGRTERGSDYEDGVIVHIDIFGRPTAAFFDPEWLATRPSAGSISRGVLAAYRQGRRRHEPPTAVHNERGRLEQQWRAANQRFGQLLGNGVLRTS